MRLNNWPKIAGLLLSGSFSIRMELDHPGNHPHPVLLLRHQATWKPGPLLRDDGVRSGMLTAAWCSPTFQALHDSSLGAGLCRAPGRLVQSVGKPSQREPCLTYGGGHLGLRKRSGWPEWTLLGWVQWEAAASLCGCRWLQHPWSRNQLPRQRLFPQQ